METKPLQQMTEASLGHGGRVLLTEDASLFISCGLFLQISQMHTGFSLLIIQLWGQTLIISTNQNILTKINKKILKLNKCNTLSKTEILCLYCGLGVYYDNDIL